MTDSDKQPEEVVTPKDETKEPLSKIDSKPSTDEPTDKPTDEPEDKPAAKSEEATPAPPARPLSPHAEAQKTLQEAFPTIDKSIIQAILIASQYKLEPAFSALLAMSDPNYKPEEIPPVEEEIQRTQSKDQIAEDEALARKLAAEYERSSSKYPPPPARAPSNNDYSSSSRVRKSTSSGYSGRYDEPRPVESERSFFDDDLPEIKANFEKGFNETKAKVSTWMNNFRKKIDGENGQPGIFGAIGGPSPRSSYDNHGDGDENEDYSRQQQQQQRPSRYNNGNRRTYDRDPNEISDDFQGISLRDEVDAPPKPPRPSTELKKTTSNEAPRQPNRPRAVSALGDDEETSEEITKSFAPPPLSATAKLSASTTPANAKWEPLKSVAPEPEADKDPFFIGDSDEDEDEEEPTNTAASTTTTTTK